MGKTYTQTEVDSLITAIIERCAKVCEQTGHGTGECPEMANYCAENVRALESASPLPEGFTEIGDYIAKQEKNPQRKAALDRARERLKSSLIPGLERSKP